MRVRLLSYTSIVESVLLYNCSTWALSEPCAKRLDVAQRSMLRRVLGISMIDKISNTEQLLYAQCHVLPASLQVMHARWRMFGHTLRMPADTPARKVMLYYFTKEVDIAGRQGNNNTIATALSREYESVSSTKINDLNQFNKIVVLAQNRNAWRELVNDIFIFYKTKYERELEKRRIAQQQAEEIKTVSVGNV